MLLALALFSYFGISRAYVWPSPQLDALEAQRWDQDDKFSGLAGFIEPCDFFTFGDGTGRANTADWIRTAYHDMATHNIVDGTGGLDASIRFPEEQSRGENVGTGFENTLDPFVGFMSRHISLADLIAIGLITAVENCGGPQIAFRGGRIDATEPNTPGVPEPQQDLQAHIDSFARQGFTQTEMIGLIACGHTFGGVEHGSFPDTVPELNDSNNTLSVAHFDSTFGAFDNNVATEYIAGTTTNPLVVGANDTTNSDKRIFASDGNVTMKSFADSPDLFASTCATLLARMLDTVPRDVKLTDVIEPLPVKPTQLQLIHDGDSLKLSGLVRLFNQSDDPSRSVVLQLEDRAGNKTSGIALQPDHISNTMGGRVQSAWYAFNETSTGTLSIDPAAGLTKLSFTVNGKLEDQGGVGFAIQDGALLSSTSCLTSFNPIKGRFDVAVRNGLNPTRVFLEQDVKDDVGRISVKETDLTPPAQPVPAGSAYSLWSINLSDPNFEFKPYTIGTEVNGVKFSTPDGHALGDFNDCAPSSQRRAQYKKRRAPPYSA